MVIKPNCRGGLIYTYSIRYPLSRSSPSSLRVDHNLKQPGPRLKIEELAFRALMNLWGDKNWHKKSCKSHAIHVYVYMYMYIYIYRDIAKVWDAFNSKPTRPFTVNSLSCSCSNNFRRHYIRGIHVWPTVTIKRSQPNVDKYSSPMDGMGYTSLRRDIKRSYFISERLGTHCC